MFIIVRTTHYFTISQKDINPNLTSIIVYFRSYCPLKSWLQTLYPKDFLMIHSFTLIYCT